MSEGFCGRTEHRVVGSRSSVGKWRGVPQGCQHNPGATEEQDKGSRNRWRRQAPKVKGKGTVVMRLWRWVRPGGRAHRGFGLVLSGGSPRCCGYSFLVGCVGCCLLLTSPAKFLGAVAFPFTSARLAGRKTRARAFTPSQYFLVLLVLLGWAPVPVRFWDWCFFVPAPVLYSSGAFAIVMGALWPGHGSSSLAQLETRTSACRLA